MEAIKLNQYEVFGTVEPAANKGEFTLKFVVKGAQNFHFINGILADKSFDIMVPSLGHEFKAKAVSHLSSYTNPLHENSIIEFDVTYRQVAR